MGILLTDPEAPALTTYPCVVFAAVAIATLAARIAPNSLLPAAGAFVYLFYYLVSFGADGVGQFQKDHEEIAALVARYGRCAWNGAPRRSCFELWPPRPRLQQR